MSTNYINEIKEHSDVLFKMHLLENSVESAITILTDTLQRDKKIIFAGNGGSAGDSQHLAAEYVGRFESDRKPLSAMSLTVDSSIITCIANDYGYEYIFSRQLQGVAIKGDTFVAFSTSGNSTNIIKALDVSNELGINTIAFLGRDGGACRDLADCSIIIPSYSTARIQEMHLFLGHYICRQVENNILIKE